MEQIIITKPDGSLVPLANKRTATKIKSAKQNWALLANDTVSINIESPFPQKYDIGDRITAFGRLYKLNRLPKVKKTGMREFSYDLEFEGVQYDLMRATYDLTIDTTTNKLQDVQADTLTGNLHRFATVLISNACRVFPGQWSLGTCPETVSDKTLTFGEGDNCLSVLQNLCSEFGVEFEITQEIGVYTINFMSKVGQIFPYTFEFGKGKGLYVLDRQNVDSSNIVTRLKVYGSTSNITSKYRANRLCLPNKTKAQSFIEKTNAVAKYGIYEATKYFDNIKPTFKGVVTSIVAGNVLQFIDTKMFDLNALESDGQTTKYLMKGCAAKVHFNTGNLAGYEFDVHAYDHATHTFTLVKQTDERGDVFPSESSLAFQFTIGNEYKLIDVALPDQYMNDAETKLYNEGETFYDQNCQPKVQYGLSVTKGFLETMVGSGTIANIFAPGDYIPIKDADIDVDKSVRIQSLTRNLLDEYDYSLTISDTVSTNITNRVISDLIDIDKVITINDLNNPSRTRANWRSSRELLNMVFDPDGDYYTDKIKPGSIETLMLSVGAKSMQLMLQNTLFEANYNGNKNLVKVTGGVLTHYAIEENIRNWNLATATTTLSGDSDAFYIYAKCQKSGSAGSIIFSKTQIRVDENINYYHFWLGVIHSVMDEVRAISLTYGATTINGKFIRTGHIESSDGSCFINLDGNGFRLGSNACSLTWNNNNDRKLRLKGTLVQSPSGDENALSVFRGSYSSYTLYYSGDEVTYNGSMYHCIQNCPTAGIMPINTTYWQLVAQKGTDGGKGDKGNDGAPGEMSPIGKMLYRNPDFSEGTNNINIYNNNGNGTVAIDRISRISDCPNNSTHCIRIMNKGDAEPGLGGFYFATMTRSNAKFMTRIIAKIPTGYSIAWASNAAGDGGFHKWITPQHGTGKFEEYICIVQCGVSGSFSSTNFFYLNGGADGTTESPVVWYLAYATVFDATQAEIDYVKEIDKSIDVQPVCVYRGNYSSSVGYTGSNQRIDVVKYNNVYYRARRKVNGSFSNQTPSDDSSYWENFGAQFESIATNLILAEGASIGNWSIQVGKIVSTLGSGNKISLDASGSKIEVDSSQSGGDYSQDYGQGSKISLNANSGTIEARSKNSYSKVAYMSPTGIFANNAETQAVAASLGITRKAAIVGLGYGNVAKDNWQNENFIAGVYGTASNSGNAPAYGGFFQNLMAAGLMLNAKSIDDNSGTTYLTEYQSFVLGLANKGVTRTVYLPNDGVVGRIIFAKQIGVGQLRFYPRSGQYIHDDSSANDYYDIPEGWMGIFVFTRFMFNGVLRQCWTVSRLRF